MENKTIRCQDCFSEFTFTVKQQKIYGEKGWADPIRCPTCRERKKKLREASEDYRMLMHGAVMRIHSGHGRGYFRRTGR